MNQQRQVVEEVLEFGRPYNFGLEAGSKPELLAVMALADNETPIICNGFKDDEYIEMVMLAQKIGRKIIPVVEKYTELDLILKYSQRVGVRPVIGLRVKLASRGSGRWKSSGGYRSKFGLTVTEALRALEELKDLGMEDCLQLLHFHLGSQITNIRQIKGAVNEAARVYVELARAGAGLQLPGRRRRPGHRLRRLADRFRIERQLHAAGIRQRRRLSHPERLRRSRGAASDHRLRERPRHRRVSQRAGVQRPGRLRVRRRRTCPTDPPADAEQPLIDLEETYRGLTREEPARKFSRRAAGARPALNLFSLGYLPLEQRCLAENLYWVICRAFRSWPSELDYFPEELEGSTPCSPTPTSAISRCSRACRIVGR